jgi:general secretion pathway protein K
VQFDDETGRPSLQRLTAPMLTELGRQLGLKETDATLFAEALLVWTSKEQTSARFETDPRNYEYRDPPHRPPGRPLASFGELAAIAGVRELFYTPDGQPNELHARFARSVSLHDFPAINLNTVDAETLRLAGLDANQSARLLELNSGQVSRAPGTPPYFRSVADAQVLVGATTPLAGFDTLVRCLRIQVTVREGATSFHLIATVSPGNPDQSAAPAGATAALPSAPAPKNLGYPFTLLAIEEKIELAPPPVS